jgi:type II secretory pathway component PulK
VLLAVLWILVGVSLTGMAVALVARREVRSARNRRDEVRDGWVAEDCAQRALAVLAAALQSHVLDLSVKVDMPDAASAATSAHVWRSLDSVMTSAPLLTESPVLPHGRCRVALDPGGRTIDVNTADAELLGRALQQLAVPAARVDSLVDAVLDWRDPDALPRAKGAEGNWYLERGRPPPRNGPFGDVRELSRVRGLEHLAGLDSLFGVEPGAIVLDRAPFAVIAALPGFTAEAIARVAEHRLRGAPVGNLLAFSAELSPSARSQLLAHYQELIRLTASEPEAWRLVVYGETSGSPVTAVLELRLARAGNRAAIVRRRTWVE